MDCFRNSSILLGLLFRFIVNIHEDLVQCLHSTLALSFISGKIQTNILFHKLSLLAPFTSVEASPVLYDLPLLIWCFSFTFLGGMFMDKLLMYLI